MSKFDENSQLITKYCITINRMRIEAGGRCIVLEKPENCRTCGTSDCHYCENAKRYSAPDPSTKRYLINFLSINKIWHASQSWIEDWWKLFDSNVAVKSTVPKMSAVAVKDCVCPSHVIIWGHLPECSYK